jgi:ribonuclease HII
MKGAELAKKPLARSGLFQSLSAVPTEKVEDGFFWEKFGKLAQFDASFAIRPLAGIDEAGRGPLAGPLVAAAVILDPGKDYPGIDDSKRLKEEDREKAFAIITDNALAFSYAIKSPSEVDRYNPLGASLLAMVEAFDNLTLKAQLALVDGNKLPALNCRAVAVVHGDALSLSIAAASIVAKVVRDRLMLEQHKLYPGYGFDQHKGYGTQKHLEALSRLGPSPIHRLTYRGVLPPTEPDRLF